MSTKGLKILFVSSEVAPYAKTGGLADVAGSLPRALARLGHDVRVVLPKYRVVSEKLKTITDFPVPMAERKETAIIRTTEMGSSPEPVVPVYFIDNYQYFDRENLYVYYDEAERFAFFCKSVLEMLPKIDFQPDLIHCNDWQSGPISTLLNEKYRTDPFYEDIATLITIHNLHYQGNYPKGCLDVLGLSEHYFHPDRLEFYGDVSFVKAGLVYADIVNTVSKKYAEEIKTPEYGERMEGLLRKRSGDLYGIVNGIDLTEWNPASDQALFANYDAGNIAAKAQNKQGLQRLLRLPERDVPVLGLISRLVGQKGLDLIVEVFEKMMKLDVQLVILGTGDPQFENFFRGMKKQYPDKLSVHIGFSEKLAKQIYAGADIFLMPSRFEPCGLGQLIALRYGTIPVVRATGGLADTVRDFTGDKSTGNGFVFTEYNSEKMLAAIQQAVETYHDRDAWSELVQRALSGDYSWDKSALEYVNLYQKALEKRSSEKAVSA